MAILTPGYEPGAHGRKSQATWDRRSMYLAREQGREGVSLFQSEGQGIRETDRQGALEALGGKGATYHEVIVAFSEAECLALEARADGNRKEAQRRAAEALGARLSEDRPFLVAVHEDTERWHLHVDIQGEQAPRLFGPRGDAQKAFEGFWRASTPPGRIQDWEAHRRAIELQAEARSLSRQIQTLDRDRRQALRLAPDAPTRARVGRGFDERAHTLVFERFRIELAGIEARHLARGTGGSWEHKVDVERAGFRRHGADNRIQVRANRLEARATGKSRPGLPAARRTDRTLGQGREALLRGTQRSIRTAERVATLATDAALRHAGVPKEARQAARYVVRLAGSALKATARLVAQAIRSSLELTKAATPAVLRQAQHAAKITAQMGAGAVLALPTLGKSLGGATKESGKDLGAAGKDLGKDGAKVLRTAGREASQMAQEGLRAAASLGVDALPRPAAQLTRAAIEAGRTVSRAAVNVVNLDVLGAGASALEGTARTAAKAMATLGQAEVLPEPLRLASRVIEKTPLAGSVLGLARNTAELAHSVAKTAKGLSMEVER